MSVLSILLTLLLDFVPKGTLQEVYYKTSVPGPSERRMEVYLPEGYFDNDRRYPVVYLIHGAKGTELAWINNGEIIPVVDSLQSAGIAEKFILVMPNMNQYNDDKDFAGSRAKKPVESLFDIDGTVETAFASDVVHYVDSVYRTLPDKKHRALAGLSVGGLQTIYISANNPDMFDYLGLFSPMVHSPLKPGEYNDFYDYFKDKIDVQFSDPPSLYYICIGRTDIFYFHIKGLMRYLRRKDYPFEYKETRGGHSWRNWKPYCRWFLQRVFK